MPRVRARSSAVTTDHGGLTYHVTTEWQKVPDEVALKLARSPRIEVESEPESASEDETDTEVPARRRSPFGKKE